MTIWRINNRGNVNINVVACVYKRNQRVPGGISPRAVISLSCYYRVRRTPRAAHARLLARAARKR